MTELDLSEIFRKQINLNISSYDLTLLRRAVSDYIPYLKEYGDEIDKKRGGNSKVLLGEYERLLAYLEQLEKTEGITEDNLTG